MNYIPDAISVIIPTYNRAHLIKDSIQSVLDQTLQPYEIIVVDDFSTDNTEEVVNSFNSPLIKYIKNQRKKGANGARNTGILMAQGEFIAFQDSDDVWLPEKLEKQFLILKKNPEFDMCFCSLITENNIVVPARKINSVNIKKELSLRNFISTQTIFMYKKQAIQYLFDEDLKRFQDWDFVLRLSVKRKIYHLDIPLAVQKLQASSITNTISYLAAYEILYKKHPELINNGIYNKIVYKEMELKIKYSLRIYVELFILKIMRHLILAIK